MNHSTTATRYFDNIAASAGPSPLGMWLKTTFRNLVSRSAATPRPTEREREAAELRAYAQSIRGTDPRQADDLFAAADHHENLHV
jgi:hypothetical protein